MSTPEASSEPADADSRRPRWVAPSAAAVVALGAIIAAAIVIGGDEPVTAAPLSQVKASCTEWLGSTSAVAKPDDRWCTEMFAWMANRSGDSMMSEPGDSAMGNMVWHKPERMGRVCREWVSEERGENGSAGEQQCDAMIGWMDGHMASQGGQWMMQNR